MLECFPKIVVDDLAAPAAKRRRLNTPSHTGGVTIDDTYDASECEPSGRETASLSTCATAEAICEDTLVCYGMVRRTCSSSWFILTLLRYPT
jgi:hypothetical protein